MDREHYGYQCHACVVREHELELLMKSDPDHPGVEWLDSVPVNIGLPERVSGATVRLSPA